MDNTPVTTIKFDKLNNKIIVNSTGKIADTNGEIEYFKFTLSASDGITEKITYKIGGNMSDSNFSNNISNQSFQNGDIVTLAYQSSDKVIITNFPDLNTPIYTPTVTEENFRITPNGLVPATPTTTIPQKIEFGNLATVSFNARNKQLNVTSTGNISNLNFKNTIAYLFKLRDSSNNIKEFAFIKFDENANAFTAALNNKSFEYGDIIELDSFTSSMLISNLPNVGKITPVGTKMFNMSTRKHFFKISPQGLQTYTPNMPLPTTTLPNTIKINTIYDNPTAAINFNILDKVIQTFEFGNNDDSSNVYNYVNFKLYDSNNNLITSSDLRSGSNPSLFSDGIKFKIFHYNYILELTYDDRSKSHMIITNVQGSDHVPSETKERYKITMAGLIPIPIYLRNTINIKSISNTNVAFIKFNIIDKKLEVKSSSSIADFGNNYSYITFRLYNSTDIKSTNLVKMATLVSNINGTGFASILNLTNFQFDYVVELTYDNRAKANVEITNFPTQGQTYIPNINKEYYKITVNGLESYTPSKTTFPTLFIFKSLENNREMVRIEFDKATKKLAVTSTGVSYGGQGTSDVFSFEIFSRYLSSIKSNENGNNFRSVLNDKDFDYYDSITLGYSDKTKVILENYPNLGDTYSMIGTNSEKFTITKKGVIPTLTPYVITVKSKTNEELLSIGFIEKTKKIIVFSTGIVPDDTSSEPYFTFILKDENGQELLKGILNSNENGSVLEKALDGKPIDFGNNILNLFYKDKRRIEISNYPNFGDSYTPDFSANIFRVFSNDLEDLSFNNKIKIINDNSEEVSTLYFIKPLSQPIVGILATATNKICTNLLQPNEKYIQYVHYDVNNVKLYKELLGREISTDFSTTLNTTNFQGRSPFDIIRVSNKISDRIIINDYKGQREYKVGEEPEFINVTNSQLTPHNLNYNKITFKNSNGSRILFIYFDKVNRNTIYIQPYSTGTINNDSDSLYFKLLDGNTDAVKFEGRINRGESGNLIKISTDNSNIKKVEIGDILELGYFTGSLVEISNFPTVATPIYNPKGTKESFLITDNGLATYKANSLDLQEINFINGANIRFDTVNKSLNVTSTGSIPAPTLENTIYYLFKLRNSSMSIKEYYSISADENGNIFANGLNNKSFKYGDIIEVGSFAPTKIQIRNFPDAGQDKFVNSTLFKMETYQEFFKITAKGLQAYTPTVIPSTFSLPNVIKFNTITNAEFIHINFNTADNVLQGFSFSKEADGSNAYDYVILKLYDENNVLVTNGTIPSHSNPFPVVTKLNLKKFDYDYTLDLTYDYRARPNIIITNLQGKDHIPDHSRERYKITRQGLEFIPIFLPNIITINGVNDKTVATIEFDIINNRLKAISFNNIADLSSNYDYITVKFFHLIDDALAHPVYIAILKSNENPIDFINNLNSMYFIYGFILEIICDNKILNKVNITNFQGKGQTHTITKNNEYFKVTNTQLESYTPVSILQNNVIKVSHYSDINTEALTIKFDMASKTIKATANSNIIGVALTNWSSTSALIFTLKDENGTTKKYDYVYGKDDRWSASTRDGLAINFANNINNTPFDYGYSIELYAPSKKYNTITKTHLTISNLPFKSNDYVFFNDTETFTITPLGLVLTSNSTLNNTNLLKDIIIMKTPFRELMAQIYFDIKSKKILVSTTTASSSISSSMDFFVFKLTDKAGNENIARITATSNADSFAEALNNKISFDFGYTITLAGTGLISTFILNNPSYGDVRTPIFQGQKFTITPVGLV